MRKCLCALLPLLLANGPLCAQKTINLNELARTQYVERFPNYYFVWPVVMHRTPALTLQSVSNSNQKLIYQPNARYYAGFGVYVFQMGIQAVLALPTSSQSNAEFGKSKAFDLQARIIGKHWGVDLVGQHYRGFYVDDRINPVPAGQPMPQRPDLESLNYGITGIYLFNKYRFSLRATVNYYERQLKSAGSFLVAGTLHKYSFEGDSSLYGVRYEPLFGSAANFKQMNGLTFGAGPGYAYNLALHKRVLLAASLAIGPSINWVSYKTEADVSTSSATWQLFTDLRVSLSYNSERLFGGISYIRQAREIEYAGVHFTTSNDALKLVVGYRFQEVGILKHSIKDLFKPKGQ